MDNSSSYTNAILLILYLFAAIFVLLSIFLTILGEHQQHVRDLQVRRPRPQTCTRTCTRTRTCTCTCTRTCTRTRTRTHTRTRTCTSSTCATCRWAASLVACAPIEDTTVTPTGLPQQ